MHSESSQDVSERQRGSLEKNSTTAKAAAEALSPRKHRNYYSSNENKRSSKSLGRPTLLLEATEVLRATGAQRSMRERDEEAAVGRRRRESLMAAPNGRS